MATRVRRRRRTRRGSNRKGLKLLAAVVVVAAASLAVAGGIAASWAIRTYNDAPSLASLKPVKEGRSSVIFAADGSRIGFIQAPEIRQPVPSDMLPDYLKRATVAIEDRNFYKHDGVDVEGIIRAGYEDVLAGEIKQGGSTITQQLVRNLYIQNPEDTIARKLKEAKLANEYEDEYSKKYILTKYLNTAPYGTVGGETAIGAEAAAETYFSKRAKDLNLRESALLAGLPQAPSQYNPILDPDAALDRRNEVLQAMADSGYITQERADSIATGGLGLKPGDKYQSIEDPILYDLVSKELIDRYGVNFVRNGGLKIYTSIDPELQEYAQSAVESSCYVCYDGGGPAAALASVNPENGEIVAYGSTQTNPDDSQFNYALQAQRQPGSSFKAFVLAAAVAQGIDPDSTYYDGTSPKTLTDPAYGTFTVNNSEGGAGTYDLTSATAASVNVVFAQLDLDVGPDAVTEMAQDMGITSQLDSLPAEALGGLTYGVTPLEMANAYATLANGGVHHDATAVSKVVFPGGKVDTSGSDGERVLSEGEAYEVTKALEGVITGGTGAGYVSSGCSAQAGKTGTTEGNSDAWFVGYTPKYSTAVWVGHPESRDYTGYGGPTAGPIWSSYMTSAVAGDCPEFVQGTEPDLEAYTEGNTSSSSSESYYDPSYVAPTDDDSSEEAPEPDVSAPETPTPSVPAPAPIVPSTPSVSGGVGAGN